jgi:hypothetical protein
MQTRQEVIQTSLPYKLTLPSGSSRIVGPDSSEPGFLAHLTRITTDVALDFSDTQIAAGDGALIGDMYRGGRSVVLDLLIAERDPVERARRIEWISRLNGLLRGPEGLTLSWKEATGWEKEVSNLRPAAYITVSDAWPKELQVTLKTGSPFILSSEIHSREIANAAGQTELFNGGTAPASPRFWVYGPFSNFEIANLLTGEQLLYSGFVPVGDYLEIDTARRTVLRNGTQNAYGGIDFSTSSFFSIPPLSAEVPLSFSAAGGASPTRLVTRWQSSWE